MSASEFGGAPYHADTGVTSSATSTQRDDWKGLGTRLASQHACLTLYTYGPVASTETHRVGYTSHWRGEVEVVIIAVDHTCSQHPPWAIVRVIIVTRSVAAEAEIEAVVA